MGLWDQVYVCQGPLPVPGGFSTFLHLFCYYIHTRSQRAGGEGPKTQRKWVIMKLQSIFSSQKEFTECLLYSQPSDELFIFSSFALLPKEKLEAKLESACDFTCIKHCPFSTREPFCGEGTVFSLDCGCGYIHLYRWLNVTELNTENIKKISACKNWSSQSKGCSLVNCIVEMSMSRFWCCGYERCCLWGKLGDEYTVLSVPFFAISCKPIIIVKSKVLKREYTKLFFKLSLKWCALYCVWV